MQPDRYSSDLKLRFTPVKPGESGFCAAPPLPPNESGPAPGSATVPAPENDLDAAPCPEAAPPCPEYYLELVPPALALRDLNIPAPAPPEAARPLTFCTIVLNSLTSSFNSETFV